MPLNHGNQIAVIVINYKTNWTITPRTRLVEVGKPLSVFSIGGIEDHIGSTVEC
jgi:hypothetical protein